jgi:hypothetical protein
MRFLNTESKRMIHFSIRRLSKESLGRPPRERTQEGNQGRRQVQMQHKPKISSGE